MQVILMEKVANLGNLGASSGDGGEAGLRHIYEGFLRIGRLPVPTLVERLERVVLEQTQVAE